MNHKNLRVFVAGLALVSFGASAQAKVKLTTKYQYYTVSGTTAAALHRNMSVPTGFFSSERAYADITMKPKFVGTFTQGKICRIKGFGIKGQFTIRLPKLKSGVKLSRSLDRKFRGFARYVRKHELTHRGIWLGCLNKAQSRINSLRGKSCTRLDQKAADIITAEWKKCGVRNARFDAREQKRLRRLPLVREAFKPAKRPKRPKPPKRIARKQGTGLNALRRRSLGKANDFN